MSEQNMKVFDTKDFKVDNCMEATQFIPFR